MLILGTSFIVFTLTVVLCGAEGDQPVLEIRPRGESFIRPLDSNIVFTCNVANIGAQLVNVELHWYDKHGTEIVDPAGGGRRMYVEYDGPSTRKLYIHVAQEHEGTYTCSGTVEGNKQTRTVTLTLFKDITCDDCPSPQHPIQYHDGLIKCRVSGQPIPTVSWRYRGVRIQTGGRYTQDMYGLRIQNITTADDGTYYCRAEVDSDGRYEEIPIEVIVYVPPAIVPSSLQKFEGEQSQQFTLPCRATGLPAPVYTFYKDGNDNAVYSTERIEVDREAGNVHFRPLHKEDGGRYRCDAYNDAGQTSVNLTLRVIVPPTIYNLKNVTGVEGLSVTIVCLSYGDPAPVMAFRKAGEISEYTMGDNDNGRITMTNPEDGKLELTIRNLVPSDMANYTCKSVNKAGFHVLNGTITVNFRPRFPEDHIKDVYIWAGKTRNITCHVLAEPLPLIEWLNQGRVLVNNETYRIYIMSKDSNLQVTVREADQGWVFGKYICRAKNQYGTGEIGIQLRRADVPDVPRSVTERSKSTTIVELAVEPPVLDGGVPVYAYRIDYEGRTLMFQIDEDIIIENLHASTTYVFQVRAVNEVGVGLQSQIMVTTKDICAPSKLTIISDVYGRSSYEYDVTWKKPETGGMPIIEYIFRLRKIDGPLGPTGPVEVLEDWKDRHRPESPDAPSMYYTIGDLTPSTWYQLEVSAMNAVGWGPPNDPFAFRTADGDIPIIFPSEGPVSSGTPGLSTLTGNGSKCSICLCLVFNTVLTVILSIIFSRSEAAA